MKSPKFYCTNRGEHRRIDLRDPMYLGKSKNPGKGAVGRKRDHGKVVLQYQVRLRGERTPEGYLDHDKPIGVELLCPKCGRNPRIAEQKLILLREAGLAEVDISSLPF